MEPKNHCRRRSLLLFRHGKSTRFRPMPSSDSGPQPRLRPEWTISPLTMPRPSIIRNPANARPTTKHRGLAGCRPDRARGGGGGVAALHPGCPVGPYCRARRSRDDHRGQPGLARLRPGLRLCRREPRSRDELPGRLRSAAAVSKDAARTAGHCATSWPATAPNSAWSIPAAARRGRAGSSFG